MRRIKNITQRFLKIGLGAFILSFLNAEEIFWEFGTIHCKGDSHCGHCFTNSGSWHAFLAQSTDHMGISEKFVYRSNNMNIPFCVRYQGPITMHRVGRDGAGGQELQPQDICVYMFGEIDVRVHIGRQIYQKGRAQTEVIQTLVKNYIDRIAEAKNLYGFNCVVCSVLPPSREGYSYENNSLDDYLPSAPLSDRILYTRQLNELIAHECKKNEILFFSPFADFTSAYGSLNHEFSSDQLHLDPKFNSKIKEDLILLIINHLRHSSR